MKNKIITIFGGSGFVGSYIVKELAKTGAYIKIVSRNPEKAAFLKTAGEVGQIYLQSADVNDPDSLTKAIKNSDIVINLVGILFEKGRNTFKAINKCAAVNIARISKEQHVKHLIHFSALNVNRAYESKYAHYKYKAEKEVQKEFPKVVIVRSSLIFGSGDNFFNLFARMASTFHVLPLIYQGHTKFQPVYVGDIAKAVTRIIDNIDNYEGKVFELAGNDIYSYKEMMKLLLRVINQKALMISIPTYIAYIIAFFMEFLPHPLLTRDQIKLLKYHNVIHKEEKLLYLSTLNIRPKTIEQIVPIYLECFKKV
jgi:NADH dehydrogenase